MAWRGLAILFLTLVMLGGLPAGAARAAEATTPQIDALGKGGFSDVEAGIVALAATGDARVVKALEALQAGDLYVRKADGHVVIARATDDGFALTDPLTGAALEAAPRSAVDKIRVNNSVRRALEAALSGMTLMSPDPAIRRQAADSLFKSRDPGALPLLDQALAAETVPSLRRTLEAARASILLTADGSEADKLAAITTLSARGDRDALSILSGARAGLPAALQAAADKAIAGIERSQAAWGVVQNLWYGVSLGSVLLLAAIGLAITFGVMGVINMAHGEMVMLGAYTTYVVQELIRTRMPGLFDASLVIALPMAFLVTGAAGVVIERSVIRWLYGRPLETLLATWGLSLALQQAVRSIFGPSNREVGNPSFMSGTFDVGQISITYGRLWIVVFAALVFAALILLLSRTSFGLRMRAVTQNRPMAGAMGIATARLDALTFGLGSGIAGIAGVALSQIDNVSPNLGQGYIIDSFMVVVLGGVGNLWGTLVGAATLGIANKFLEPYAGAVLGKILVLVLLILFIQKRPRGLFALKGRAVES